MSIRESPGSTSLGSRWMFWEACAASWAPTTSRTRTRTCWRSSNSVRICRLSRSLRSRPSYSEETRSTGTNSLAHTHTPQINVWAQTDVRCSSQTFKQLEQNHSGEPGDPAAVRHRQHMEQIQSGTRASGEKSVCLWISLITLCVCVLGNQAEVSQDIYPWPEEEQQGFREEDPQHDERGQQNLTSQNQEIRWWEIPQKHYYTIHQAKTTGHKLERRVV